MDEEDEANNDNRKEKKKHLHFYLRVEGLFFVFFVLLPLSPHTALLYHLYILIKMIA